jgi:hypothetical protein
MLKQGLDDKGDRARMARKNIEVLRIGSRLIAAADSSRKTIKDSLLADDYGGLEAIDHVSNTFNPFRPNCFPQIP